MNTITTNKAASKGSSELVIMLLICAIGLFGAFSLMGSDQNENSWQGTTEIEKGIYSGQEQANETIVLD